MEGPNKIVQAACMNLICNLDCDVFKEHPYSVPFMKYVLLWPYCLPIKTIIVGQNPYPQNIYPEYGSALSYDSRLCRSVPPSVQVIAEDLYNTLGVPKQDTICCFRDLWHMTNKGIIAINETVFSRIVNSEKESNLRPIREAEFQIRALQVLISESYSMGQTSFTCVGMGMNAAMMVNTIRQWCPNDIVSIKTITCSNPAAYARNLGDTESLPITFGNSALSKLFASIVKDYVDMPPKKDDRRTQQNIEALKATTENVASAAAGLRREYSSFVERFESSKKPAQSSATLEDVSDSLDRLVGAAENHAMAIRAQMVSFIVVSQSVISASGHKPEQQKDAQSTIQSFCSYQQQTASSQPQSPVALAPRRQVRRAATPARSTGFEASVVASIPEEAGNKPDPDTKTEVTQSPSIIVSRRRVVRRSLRATPSIADTEYTSVTTGTNKHVQSGHTASAGITPVEAVHMVSIAQWMGQNMAEDTSYHDMIMYCVDENCLSSEPAREVLNYVRKRMAECSSYDSHDELEDMNSHTSIWCNTILEKVKPQSN